MNDNLIHHFLNLVCIDSPSGEESFVADYLKKWFDEYVFEYKTDTVGNIYACRRGSGNPFLFSGHMDTVEPGRGIKPIVENDVIKSNGTTILGADNKAALAAILGAVEEYLQEIEDPRTIELVFTVKEETGGGIEHFPFGWIQSRCGVLFDFAVPVGGIVLSSPFITNFRVVFTGKAAHSRAPEKGINALIPAAAFISKIEQGNIDDGKTTVNIGMCNGGTGINIIPGEVIVEGEVRSFDKNLFENRISIIEQTAKHCAADGTVCVLFTQEGFCPGYTFLEHTPLIKSIVAVFDEVGISSSFYHSTNITDSNVFIAAGIDVITLSDGVEFPHTFNEQVSLKSLELLQCIVKKFLQAETTLQI
ncbi:MAG: M20/M25/M40 family metallo-hydrolase [bacterium]